jgi:glutathione synthase/RimK-type ligase-like ATP-grasp enzyme
MKMPDDGNKIAFLTMENLDGFCVDDDLAKKPLGDSGWETEDVCWRQTDTDWSEFAAVIIRSTWDYPQNLEAFLQVLGEIEIAARLANPLSLVRWNADKSYLLKFQEKGIGIVPTVLDFGVIEERQIAARFADFQTDEIVVKPTVGANAQNTFRLGRNRKFPAELTNAFRDGSYLIQPFMKKIVTEGEFSLFYFAGKYSHAVLKTPKNNDFRVQEEHGGLILPVTPEPQLLEFGGEVMRRVAPVPLYARVDAVRGEENRFALMELELIEPSLYLRTDEKAAARFARAINDWIRKN